MTEQKRKPAYRKPCPNLPKGQRCPLCGGAYICLQSARKKINIKAENAS